MATLGDYFEAVYDVTIIYESRSGHKVRTPAPGMFGEEVLQFGTGISIIRHFQQLQTWSLAHLHTKF